MTTDAEGSGASDPTLAKELERHEALLAGIRVRSRRIAILYSVGGVLLIPWTVYLAVTLPRRDLDTHYRGAWVGFDLLLVATIILTAYFARVQLPATATATLLIVDAWFDVMTAGRRQSTLEAVLMALCIEIPAALFSLWLARRVNRNAGVLIAYENVLRQNS
jgi:hypothetical protein